MDDSKRNSKKKNAKRIELKIKRNRGTTAREKYKDRFNKRREISEFR